MKGTILNISRFCTDDGPGIRTTVFLKGCPLSCVWCHNPESQSRRIELLYSQETCVGCRRCEAVCPVSCHSFSEGSHRLSRRSCIGCGECVKVCPAGSLELAGKVMEAEEVFREVEKDAVFYQKSGGGVTVSGGEPLAQPEFTAELLRLCRENGIGTAIETSGYAGKEAAESVLRYCDFVLFDIKETDEARHKRFVGGSLLTVIETLRRIEESGIPFRIRMPIIPGFNDRGEHFAKVRELGKQMTYCRGIEIMPYHMLGTYKYAQLQRPYLCAGVKEPAPETVEQWRKAVK